MTEELKQKAKNYAWNYPIPYSLYEKIDDKKEQMGEVIEQAYLDGAKELEEENNKLLDVINNQDVKIADLEKQIEKMKKCAICVDRHIWCVDCVNKSKFRLDVEIKDEN